MHKKEYYLAYTTNIDSTFQTSNIQISLDEVELINSKIVGFNHYENNKYYLMMVVWSFEDLKNLFEEFGQDYFQELQSGELLRPDHFEIDGRDVNLILNSEIIKTLALAEICLDYFEAFIKRRNDNETLEFFKKLTHDSYDNLFSYRFSNQLRDYSIHYALPLEFVKITKSPINVNNTKSESIILAGMSGSIVVSINPIVYHDSDEDEGYIKAWEEESEKLDFKLVVSKEKLVSSGFNWKNKVDQEIADQEEFINIADHLYKYIGAIMKISNKSMDHLSEKLSDDAKFVYAVGNKLNIKEKDIKEVYIKTVLVNENTGDITNHEEQYFSLGIERLTNYMSN
jgi:hypothetical protein